MGNLFVSSTTGQRTKIEWRMMSWKHTKFHWSFTKRLCGASAYYDEEDGCTLRDVYLSFLGIQLYWKLW